MTARTAAILSWTIVGFAIAMFFFALATSMVFPFPGLPATRLVPGVLREHIGGPAGAAARLVFSGVGALILYRQPENRIGWILGAVAVLVNLEFAGLNSYAALGIYVRPGSVPAATWALWATECFRNPTFVVIVGFLPILFPDGRLPSPRWRFVLLLAGLGALLSAVGVAIAPDDLAGYHVRNPFTLAQSRALAPLLQPLGLSLILGCFVASVVSIVARYGRSDVVQRQQLKWFASAVALFVAFFAIANLVRLVYRIDLGPRLLPVGALLVATSIGIAVLKYRLYDIDVVISRTLVYGALAVFITAVYVGIVVGIGSLIGSGGKPNLALSIVATAIVAVAFQPVRERLQKVANRLVYGKRATPYEVLSQFSERVAESYAAEDVLPRMARLLADGTGAASADVWLRAGDIFRQAASWPLDAAAAEPALVVGNSLPEMLDADRAVEVRHQGELLGALTVTKRKGESLTPIEQKLLDDLAAQAGLVLKNVGLTSELLVRLDDLRASRQRLVAAQDQERRRLERNLHDGAQQNLVALKVKLGLVEAFTDRDPEKARQLLGEVKADADEALETLRDLARGIYPPLLADKGLGPALESQARKATLPVTVRANGIGRYSQDVEAAVYFCALEALQNIQKYAGASQAIVHLSEVNGDLRFEVSDDGKGFDPKSQPKGSGTQNMEDRLDALGGAIELTSRVGGGTAVSGWLPLPPIPALTAS